LKNPAPLLLSEEELKSSTDCFPIEFRDMRERHRVLAGADVISELYIDYAFHRAQVEHELRAKMLRLRQKAGSILSEPDLLLRLMAESLSTFLVLFRHAMMLAGDAPQFGKRAIIDAAAIRFGIEPGPFIALLDFRESKARPKQLQPEKLFGQYLKQIERLVESVDRMQR
jgi:hypothetical protein